MYDRLRRDAPIGIIGAGPGGLSTAWFLKQKGYTNVTVLEKQDQVGGLSRTMNYRGKSFDIGANYMTPAYRTIFKMAKAVGAKLYTEKSPIAIDPNTGAYSSVLRMVRGDTGLLRFMWLTLKYFLLRWRLDYVLPKAGFGGIAKKHPELAVSFADWLKYNGLWDLHRIFEIPITMMGYGALEEIPAPYALRYISTGTFRTMVLFGAGLPSRYPKRFIQGFQPFWQRIAWELDVITGVDIARIERTKQGATVYATVKEQELNTFSDRSETFVFEWLIVCTPLSADVLQGFLSLTPEEKDLFGQVVYNPFAVSTFAVHPLPNRHRIFNVYPINPFGKPSIFAHQFPDNPLLTFYTRLPYLPGMTKPQQHLEKQETLAEAEAMIKLLKTSVRTDQDGYVSYDKWPYFPHVDVVAFAAGYYDRFEALQGQNRTFYCGGLANFELMEPIAQYAEYLVNRHF